MDKPAGMFSRLPFHYAWVIAALTFITVLIGGGIRSAGTLFIQPLEAEFGWSRTAISSAVGLSLLMFGVASPVAGKLIDRFGQRAVMLSSLLLVAAGLVGTLFVNAVWQVGLFWGIVVGAGSGGLATVLTATVANRWFVAHRGLVLGVFNSSSSAGQVIFLPILMAVMVGTSWRTATVAMLVLGLALIPLVLFLMRNDPEDVGLMPYGALAAAVQPGAAGGPGAAPAPPFTLATAVRTSHFWILSGAYFVCGATTGGLIGTHLIPHSTEQGFSAVTAATVLGIMGGMNFIGTVFSGWLTDRVDARKILAVVYSLRGVSLFVLPFVHDFGGLMVFAVIYGLDWFATVPPTITVAADVFGKRSMATIYGFIFLSHQIGAAVAAAGAGALRAWTGNYTLAFVIGGILGLAGGGVSLLLPPTRPRALATGLRPKPVGTVG